MKPGEEDYAVACSVPTNAEGLIDHQHHQRSSRRRHAPLPDQPSHEHARGPRSSSTTCSCRTSGCSSTARRRRRRRSPTRWGCGSARNAVAYSGSSADRLVGLAALLAEMNGAGERADIRDLLSEMAIFATMCRAGWEAAMKNATHQRGRHALTRLDLHQRVEVLQRRAPREDDRHHPRHRRRTPRDRTDGRRLRERRDRIRRPRAARRARAGTRPKSA